MVRVSFYTAVRTCGNDGGDPRYGYFSESEVEPHSHRVRKHFTVSSAVLVEMLPRGARAGDTIRVLLGVQRACYSAQG